MGVNMLDMGGKFDRTAYMREYMKNKTAQRKRTEGRPCDTSE